MTIETAYFVVQRGSQQFKCLGSELSDKLQTGDLLAVQHNDDKAASKWAYGDVNDILDTDWLGCTDTDDVTYKVRGSEFKGLFKVPEVKVTVEKYDYVCKTSSKPGSNSTGGRMQVVPKIEWIDPQGPYSVNVLSIDYWAPRGYYDPCSYSSSGRYYYHDLRNADPQTEIDPTIEPIIPYKVKYELRKGDTVVDTITSEPVELEAGPSYSTGSGILSVIEEKVLENFRVTGPDDYSFSINHECFNHPHTECMRPCFVSWRHVFVDKDHPENPYWNRWLESSGLTQSSTGAHDGDYIVFQAKYIVKAKYYPSSTYREWHEYPAVDDQMLEFAVKFNDSFSTQDKSRITLEVGGTYGFDQQNSAPVFNYK